MINDYQITIHKPPPLVYDAKEIFGIGQHNTLMTPGHNYMYIYICIFIQHINREHENRT